MCIKVLKIGKSKYLFKLTTSGLFSLVKQRIVTYKNHNKQGIKTT